MARNETLIAKRLRTGEIAVWDPDTRSIILVAVPKKEGTVMARIVTGRSFAALQEVLKDVVVLGG